MILKNIKVIDILLDGRGVGRSETKTVFIEGAVFGETLDCQVIREKKNYLEARKLRTGKQSEYYTSPPCPYFESCGGCSLQNIDYNSEILLKKKLIKAALKKNAGIDLEDVEIIPSKEYGYRNKLRLQVSADGSLGFLKKYSKEIVPVKDCLLGRQILRENLGKAEKVCKSICKIYPKTIREVTIRTNGKELLLVLRGNFNKEEINFIKKSYKDSSFNICLQNRREIIKVSGENFLIYHVLGKKLRISGTDFFQVNDYNLENLYGKAKDFVDKEGRLLDLYCGSASSSLAIKEDGLVGVDINKSAIRDALENARENGLKDYEFIAKDAKFIDKDFIRKRNIRQILLDPPRKGIDEKLADQISKVELKKIIYISCNPQTLARDIKRFSQRGFKLEKITGIDMFPQTMHVETVVLMSRK